MPRFQRLRRVRGLARQDEFKRLFRTDKTGQALRAAAARENAQINFGQPHSCGGNCHTKVAAKRNLQPAAKRRAMNGRDDGLGRGFQRCDDLLQNGFALRLAKFGDVGAREEGAAYTSHHDGLDAIVGDQLAERIVNALPHSMAERVDGRIVGQDDANVTSYLDRDFLVDLRHVGLRSASKLG